MSNKEKAEDLLVRARVKMLLREPFFGNLATRLKLTDATDWCATCSTDGVRFYYNVDYVNALTVDEIMFVFSHNVLHLVYEHTNRRGGKDKKRWDAASDFVTNLELRDINLGKIPALGSILIDEKYRGKSVNEVYEDLDAQASGDGDDDDGGDGSGQQQPGQGQGKGQGNMQTLDDHLDPNDPNQQGDSEDGSGPVRMSDAERREAEDNFKHAVMSAAKAAQGAGNIPAGVKRMLKELTEPTMDWRELLAARIKSCVQTDYMWERGNRKTRSLGIHMPDMDREDRIEVCVAIDTSGSISEKMLRDFLGEVKGIMEQFTDFEIQIWTFDTKVYNLQVFTQSNIDELEDYDIQGGGGTDFDVNWQFMKDNDIEPHRFIMMTDGYPWNSWGDADYCETIFLIHGSTTIESPFGTTAYYEE